MRRSVCFPFKRFIRRTRKSGRITRARTFTTIAATCKKTKLFKMCRIKWRSIWIAQGTSKLKSRPWSALLAPMSASSFLIPLRRSRRRQIYKLRTSVCASRVSLWILLQMSKLRSKKQTRLGKWLMEVRSPSGGEFLKLLNTWEDKISWRWSMMIMRLLSLRMQASILITWSTSIMSKRHSWSTSERKASRHAWFRRPRRTCSYSILKRSRDRNLRWPLRSIHIREWPSKVRTMEQPKYICLVEWHLLSFVILSQESIR